MAEPVADQIIRQIGFITQNYYQLLVVAGLEGAGKTAALQDVHLRKGVPLINVNLELSRSLLELTERQRTLQLPRVLGGILTAFDFKVVLLDNIEVLFAPSFKQDPLRLLQNLSRNKTLVVAWNGSISGGHITYAAPGHPEYRKYLIRDFLVVNVEPS